MEDKIIRLLDELKAFTPFNEQEEKDKDLIIKFIENNDDAFLRSNKIAHITASAWVVNKDRSKVLMVYHNIYNSWSWLGGHADGNADLLQTAIKEVKEEAGIKNVTPVSTDIFSVESLTVDGHIKKGEYVPSHLHLNVTYLLEADSEEDVFIKEDENSGVAWFAPEEALEKSTEPWFVERIYSKLIDKLKADDIDAEQLIDKIVRMEFTAFDQVNNEGGRASCQDDWTTFSIMRKSQYLTWNKEMLLQYASDFAQEFEKGHNLITEKYGRMMESTAPLKYEEIKDYFPVISQEKKSIIEQIVAIQIDMLEAFGEEYPSLAGNTRSFHTYEDNIMNTSYETYLRGEISTYSDEMLKLYGRYVVDCARNGINIAKATIENTAKLYGFKDLEAFEKRSR